MRDLPLGRFVRLRNAIQQAAAAIDVESSRTSGVALPEAYIRFRDEAREIVPDENLEEFERVCPPWTTDLSRRSPLGSNTSVHLQSQWFNEAQLLMGGLSGFLDGYIIETEMRQQAERDAAREGMSDGLYL